MPEHQTQGLTVRQHERENVRFQIEFVIAEGHRDQVRFSGMSSAEDPFATSGYASDVSSGGMGLVCPQFVPRRCEGTVRVFDPTPVGTASDGSPIHEIAFEHAVRVCRVTMESHDPTYGLGVAFTDPEPDLAARVDALMALAPVRSPEEVGRG